VPTARNSDAVGADDLLDGAPEQPLRSGVLSLKLGGYGYRWLRIRREGQRATP